MMRRSEVPTMEDLPVAECWNQSLPHLAFIHAIIIIGIVIISVIAIIIFTISSVQIVRDIWHPSTFGRNDMYVWFWAPNFIPFTVPPSPCLQSEKPPTC